MRCSVGSALASDIYRLEVQESGEDFVKAIQAMCGEFLVYPVIEEDTEGQNGRDVVHASRVVQTEAWGGKFCGICIPSGEPSSLTVSVGA